MNNHEIPELARKIYYEAVNPEVLNCTTIEAIESILSQYALQKQGGVINEEEINKAAIKATKKVKGFRERQYALAYYIEGASYAFTACQATNAQEGVKVNSVACSKCGKFPIVQGCITESGSYHASQFCQCNNITAVANHVTDEDAIEVAKIYYNDNYYHSLPDGKRIINRMLENNWSYRWNILKVKDVIDYLRSRGYKL